MSALAATRALLEQTPSPPASDADPGDVIDAALALVTARAPFVEALRLELATCPDAVRQDPEASAVLREVQTRDASWEAALARAHHVLGERRMALSRLKQSKGY